MTLTPFDRLLVGTLCARVRALTFDQYVRLGRAAGRTNSRAAARRLRRLADAGLVRAVRALVRPVDPLTAPVAAWAPGDPPPDFAALAWRLERRWRVALRPQPVLFATARSVRVFGGWASGRLGNVGQLSHDLHVAEVYLHFLTDRPERAARWVAGELLRGTAGRNQKVPDAVLVDGPVTTLAIDFGGLYDARKLAAFHRNMLARRLPYEVW